MNQILKHTISQERTYYAIIIGGGAAGLQLALAMANDSFFDDKEILIIEKEKKNINDKTWCFWEKEGDTWDHLLTHSWKKGLFTSYNGDIPLVMDGYQYKMIQSKDFYAFAKKVIHAKPNFTYHQNSVVSVEDKENLSFVTTENTTFKAKWSFDSRIGEGYFKEHKYINILQHFVGWKIELEQPLLKPDEFILMDFRFPYENKTSFVYFLPTSKKEALVEFTLFTKKEIERKAYDSFLKEYLNQILPSEAHYSIKEIEHGIIPMTTYPFHKDSNGNNIKIGTAGSWVRPSTGYSFKMMGNKIETLIDNLKKGNYPSKGILKGKNIWLDTVLLGVLEKENHLGPAIFTQMFSKNKASEIFKFLDGRTSLSEDINIIRKFKPTPFIRSLLRNVVFSKRF